MPNKESTSPKETDFQDMAVEVFATCPQSSEATGDDYIEKVVQVACWSERYGCRGILVYTDNSLVDPWLVSQEIVRSTDTLCPLVAVQPIYMHPYWVAKKVASFGHLYKRRLFLNMVAGGFKRDLAALVDDTPHDRRYDRLVEYTLIVKRLLEDRGPVTYNGEFYSVKNLRLSPSLPAELFPGILMSGSSDAGSAAARAVDATAIKYPKPPSEDEGAFQGGVGQAGVRVGVIARDDGSEAWRIAHRRFPEDRKGQLAHQLAMKVSDSVWHDQLSSVDRQPVADDSPYWLVPFQNYKTFCPYLVGSYERVAAELSRYVGLGYRTFILDIPPSEEELYHTSVVFEQACRGLQ